MKRNQKINSLKSRNVIGILSGTSIDSVDIVLMRIKGYSNNTIIKIIEFDSYKIPDSIRQLVLKCSDKKKSNVEEICKLNFLVGHLFAKCINSFLKKKGSTSSNIDIIGSHGQTIFHYPFDEKFCGLSVKSTLQIGDPSIIANITGITTVGDFRTADVAVSGNGAPLTSYLDYILFKSANKNRVLLNIGGISNLTYLKKNCNPDEVISFDTGPGNMLIDNLMRILYKRNYDKNAVVSGSGNLNEKLNKLISHDIFIKVKPPKTTGREYYGNEFIKYILSVSKKMDKSDIIRTVTEYTAFVIYYSINKYLADKVDELLVSGGGSENPVLMETLKNYLNGIKISKLDHKGINSMN